MTTISYKRPASASLRSYTTYSYEHTTAEACPAETLNCDTFIRHVTFDWNILKGVPSWNTNVDPYVIGTRQLRFYFQHTSSIQTLLAVGMSRSLFISLRFWIRMMCDYVHASACVRAYVRICMYIRMYVCRKVCMHAYEIMTVSDQEHLDKPGIFIRQTTESHLEFDVGMHGPT
jgi:hypothetical protein